ncbi:MAG: hypothetical protein ACI9P5_001173 [Saprospiraceae bacterium]|jgi:hypothetical protein|tara:strand:- start:1011 stop:1181 length:171 start_codon:yes stop_codon:yes gene_type:complete
MVLNSLKTYQVIINENFKYKYHPGWSQYEEHEGITVEKVDGKDAPNQGSCTCYMAL